jgi:hypothetical protein
MLHEHIGVDSGGDEVPTVTEECADGGEQVAADFLGSEEVVDRELQEWGDKGSERRPK